MSRWLDFLQAFWAARLDRLERLLTRMSDDPGRDGEPERSETRRGPDAGARPRRPHTRRRP